MNLASWKPGLVATAAVLMTAFLLSACGGDPAPAPETTTPAPTPPVHPTTTPTVHPTAPSVYGGPPTSTPPVTFRPVITPDTRWQDLFPSFTPTEQACIRSALGEELEATLGNLILTDADTLESEVALFSCLAPETARTVLVYSVVAGFEATEGRPVSEEEASCLQARVADVDVAAFIAATVDGLGEEAEAFVVGLLRCFPDVLLTGLLEEAGVTLDELSEEEASCLREWVGSADWQSLSSAIGADDDTVLAEFLSGLTSCAPDLVLATFLAEDGLTLDELSEEEVSCLREWLAGLDWATLMAAGDSDPAVLTAFEELAACVPALLAEPMEEEWDGIPGLGAATPATVGVAIEGTLVQTMERDVFAFQAEAGALYRADVTLGTLADSTLALYDADGRELAFNDDQAESSASRLEWEAPDAGTYYLAVGSYREEGGSYTLTVTALPNDDDHADEIGSGATPATAGVAIEGELHYGSDRDVFTFQAEEGVLYRVDVTLGTLADSTVTLNDDDGWDLAYNDDYGMAARDRAYNDDYGDFAASRLFWQAPSAGDYYVAVGGYGAGTYTLTITAFDERVAPHTCSAGLSYCPTISKLEEGEALPAPSSVAIGEYIVLNVDVFDVAGDKIGGDKIDLTSLPDRAVIAWYVMSDANAAIRQQEADAAVKAERASPADAPASPLRSEEGYPTIIGYTAPLAAGGTTVTIRAVVDSESCPGGGSTANAATRWDGPCTAAFSFKVPHTCDTGPAVPNAAANGALVRDCEGLLALRERLQGDGSVRSEGAVELNWSVELAMTSWTGVTVGGSPPRVTNLRLANSGLTGELLGWMGNLTALTELRLNGNRLTGRVPSKLGQLASLTHLFLAGNRLEGCLPSIWEDVVNSDLATLGLEYCDPPILIEHTVDPVEGGKTYRLNESYVDSGFVLFDVPAGMTIKVSVDDVDCLPDMPECPAAVIRFKDVKTGSELFYDPIHERETAYGRYIAPPSGSEQGDASSVDIDKAFDELLASIWFGPDEESEEWPIDVEYNYWDRPLAPGAYHFDALLFDVPEGVPVMLKAKFISDHTEDQPSVTSLVLQVVGGASALCLELNLATECDRYISVADGDAWSESAVGDTFDLISASLRLAWE